MARKIKQMRNDRDAMSIRMRKATLFHRRIIVTVPPWAIWLIAAATFLSGLARPIVLVTIISIITTVLSLGLVIIARRQVRALRHDVYEALHNIGNDDLELEDYDPEPPAEKIILKRMNGHRSSRVSESG